MTDAVKTLLPMWAVPRMGVRRIVVGAFGSNPGSVRVFQKNGFILTRTLNKYIEGRGELRDLHILEWNGNSSTLPAMHPSSS
jgi:RimJ/RimL family protein N-acetyltransferase